MKRYKVCNFRDSFESFDNIDSAIRYAYMFNLWVFDNMTEKRVF